MALPQPINESEASESLRSIYADIKATLDIPYVPLMFRYLGNYPIFIDRLWPTLKANIKDSSFQNVFSTIQTEAVRSTDSLISSTPDLVRITNQLITPLQKERIAVEIENYFRMQLQLGFLSIAIRERTKGWAIGAKLLPDIDQTTSSYKQSSTFHTELHEIVIAETASALSVPEDLREPLIKFIVYMHEEFISIITQEEYVFTRVQLEKILIHHVTNMPHPIFASYNEVVKSLPDQNDIAHVCYFLSEKFPVGQTVAALMWAVSLGVLKK